jgi:pimeloyl-ACP methyl ester carboxylesterase
MAGTSHGRTGPRATTVFAVEPRFRCAVIMSAGLVTLGIDLQLLDYLPRVTTPVLFLSGRDDVTLPSEHTQQPFFE